jgi:hypothetical protein
MLLTSANAQQAGQASSSTGFTPPPSMLPSPSTFSPAAFLPPGTALTPVNEDGGGIGGLSVRPHPDIPPDSPLDVLANASSDILQLS